MAFWQVGSRPSMTHQRHKALRRSSHAAWMLQDAVIANGSSIRCTASGRQFGRGALMPTSSWVGYRQGA
jgi:hypothetical protein